MPDLPNVAFLMGNDASGTVIGQARARGYSPSWHLGPFPEAQEPLDVLQPFLSPDEMSTAQAVLQQVRDFYRPPTTAPAETGLKSGPSLPGLAKAVHTSGVYFFPPVFEDPTIRCTPLMERLRPSRRRLYPYLTRKSAVTEVGRSQRRICDQVQPGPSTAAPVAAASMR